MTAFNHDIPDEFTRNATPTEAIVGHFAPAVDPTDVVAALEPLTDAEAQPFFLLGPDGIEVLENGGSALGRFFGPDRTKPRELLQSGETLVGIFGVQEHEQPAVIGAITGVGVKVLYRFGRWTYS